MPAVLVYRTGSLGDTLVAVPALWAVRAAFPGHEICLLTDQQLGRSWVASRELLDDSGIVDGFLEYPVALGWFAQVIRPFRMLRLWLEIRARRFDALVYLAPSMRTAAQVRRDRRFFSSAGIQRLIGMDGPFQSSTTDGPKPLQTVPQESDWLLARLERSGVRVPEAGAGRVHVPVTERDRAAVATWTAAKSGDAGRTWIAVGPGSKMPAKIWPRERFQSVVQRLIDEFDVWPVIFGGEEDREVGEWLLARWGRGSNAAGELGVRASLAALQRCAMYIGNDTGTMHLAVAAGLPCVAIFSSRSAPGNWYPYGNGHAVFRSTIDCEGCRLKICTERGMECLMRIAPDPVHREAAKLLRKQLSLGTSSESGERARRVAVEQ